LVSAGEDILELISTDLNDLVSRAGGVDELAGGNENTNVRTIISNNNITSLRGGNSVTIAKVSTGESSAVLVAQQSVVNNLVANIFASGFADQRVGSSNNSGADLHREANESEDKSALKESVHDYCLF